MYLSEIIGLQNLPRPCKGLTGPGKKNGELLTPGFFRSSKKLIDRWLMIKESKYFAARGKFEWN